MPFILQGYSHSQKSIMWKVDYLHQSYPNSCWYHTTRMLLEAYHNGEKRKPNTEGFDKYSAQVNRLPPGNDIKFLHNNNLKLYDIKCTPNSIDLNKLFELLKIYGPVLFWGGHVFLIVGVDCTQRIIYVHYTIPLVYDPCHPERPADKFWKCDSGGYDPSRHTPEQKAQKDAARNARLTEKHRDGDKAPYMAWLLPQNYGPANKDWDPRLREHWQKDIDCKEIPEPTVLEIQKEMADKCGISMEAAASAESAFLIRYIKSDMHRARKDFYVGSQLFGPEVSKSVQYMQMPADTFYYKIVNPLNMPLQYEKFQVAVYCPAGGEDSIKDRVVKRAIDELRLSQRPTAASSSNQ